ncbi:hypothetical protein KR018_000908 [Drosophila ironensis]|nr:hypothetical protein KR018_000908 [Drosophila ironensis]
MSHPPAAMNALTNKSPFSQIGFGAAGGFLTGYVLLKASKLVAVAAGSSILAIELALQAGLVKVDVLKIVCAPAQDQSREVQVRSGQPVHPEDGNQLREKAFHICATSGRLCVAFLGGFLLGFGWA